MKIIGRVLVVVLLLTAACGSDENGDAAPSEAVDGFVSAYNDRDTDGMEDVLASDIQVMGWGAQAQDFDGRDEFIAELQQEWDADPTVTVTESEQTGESTEEFTVEWSPAAGTPSCIEGMVVEVDGGEITEWLFGQGMPPPC